MTDENQVSDVDQTEQSKNRWLRGLFMLLFLIVYEIAEVILITLTVVQFLFSVITGNDNNNLRSFGNSLGQYVKQIVGYLTYNSEERPFPFAEWPVPESGKLSDSDATGDEPPPTTGS